MTGNIVIIGNLSSGFRYLFKRYVLNKSCWLSMVRSNKKIQMPSTKVQSRINPEETSIETSLYYHGLNSLHWGMVIPLHTWNGTNKSTPTLDLYHCHLRCIRIRRRRGIGRRRRCICRGIRIGGSRGVGTVRSLGLQWNPRRGGRWNAISR